MTQWVWWLNVCPQQYRVVVCVLVGFISALFLAFVCAIGSEQYEGIRDDLPKIDRLQKKTNVSVHHLAAFSLHQYFLQSL